MSAVAPVLLIRNEFELQDIIETQGHAAELVERDFALMVIAAKLVGDYRDALCFKGGFVLRHVHQHARFSKDIDATRINPPKHKFDAQDFSDAIRGASMRNLLALDPGTPETDTKHGLDFDQVGYRSPIGAGSVSVEISYREDVIEGPEFVAIGPPYFEPFDCPVMQLDEIAAEKLRALAQRTRPTDLADLAMIIERDAIDVARISRLTAKKFELVRAGNKQNRIADNITAMAKEYDATVGDLAPDAPEFETASGLVLGKLHALLP
jgi:predicted nucleotidyltransferase component of viral defense system